jgi:hypothetical protein
MDGTNFIEDWPEGVAIDAGILDVSYGVFAVYAKSKIGRYQDSIKHDLQRVGVRVQGRAGIIRLVEALSYCLKYEERQRMLFFSILEPEESKKKKRRLIAAVLAVIFSLAIGAALFYFSKAKDDDQPKTTFSVASAKLNSDTVPADTSQNSEPANQTESAIIDNLMSRNLFARVKENLNNHDFRLDEEKRKEAWRRLYKRVPIVSDSLEKIIKSIAMANGYEEALSLELRFDKEIFQLAGSSYRLRSDLVDDWVYSFKNKISKNKAIDSVTVCLKRVFKSCTYAVGRDKDKKYFPKYDPKNCQQ